MENPPRLDSGSDLFSALVTKKCFVWPSSSVKILGKGVRGRARPPASFIQLDGSWRVTITVERAADSIEIPLDLATTCAARAVSDPGRALIHMLELPGGMSFQGCLQPGHPGINQVHAIYLDADCNDLE